MRKFFAYFVIILFAGVLSLSFIAFTNNPIKKQKAETTFVTDTIKANCAHHEAAAGAACAEHKAVSSETATAPEKKACCKEEAGKTAAGECAQAATCKHQKETVAETK